MQFINIFNKNIKTTKKFETGTLLTFVPTKPSKDECTSLK